MEDPTKPPTIFLTLLTDAFVRNTMVTGQSTVLEHAQEVEMLSQLYLLSPL